MADREEEKEEEEAPARPAKKTKTEALLSCPYPPGNPRRQPAWGEGLPVCAVGDTERCAALLREHGVVVFRGVADGEATERAELLFWRWLETHTTARRGDPRTHTQEAFRKIGYANTGVVNAFSIGQSEFLWHCRLAVKAAWATVWGGCDDLVTSFDGCGAWRNPYLHANRPFTDGNWYHLDQNVRENPGFLGYQGLLVVAGAGDHLSGSTVVLPGSHRHFERFDGGDRGSFVRLSSKKEDTAYCDARAVQVAPLTPGDVLVWDARVVHCSAGVARGLPQSHPLVPDFFSRQDEKDKPPALARLVAYVAMLPRQRISASVAARRRAAVTKGTGSGWDARVLRNYPPPARNYRPPPAGDPRWDLV